MNPLATLIELWFQDIIRPARNLFLLFAASVRHHVPYAPDIPELPPPLTPFHHCLPSATEVHISCSFRILGELSPITEHVSHELCLCRFQPVAFDLSSASSPRRLARLYGTPSRRPSETPKPSGPSATASVSGTAEHSEMRDLLDGYRVCVASSQQRLHRAPRTRLSRLASREIRGE